MKNIFSLVLFFCFATFSTKAGDFIKTSDGIIVRPDAAFAGNAREVRLTVIAENIIRVSAMPEGAIPAASLSVLSYKKRAVKWTTVSDKKMVQLITQRLTARVDLQTGAVTFLNAEGKTILTEKQLGRELKEQVFSGEKLYSIRQDFITSSGDGWYGLGQHQDDLMNYKTYQVQLFQNNTEVAVPFLVSKNNYGILWDNSSLTQFGDVRPYQPLGGLKLFSFNGEPGWLTASYSNDKARPSDVIVTRPEASIAYEFLGDSKLYLPKEFKPENGIAKWEGSVASEMDGVHKFRFTYAGYLKVWIDNKMVLDRWRQNWNPGSAILDIPMQKDKRLMLKIEWTPYGGESYLSFKFLPPLAPSAVDAFTFSSEAGTHLDYYFVTGKNMDDVIAGYRQLTGKAVMLPKWAFGFWQSRERYKTQEELMDVVAQFRQRKIPLDNIVQDWFYWKEDQWGSHEFDAARFPAPDEMINDLHTKFNTRFMISVWPKFYEGVSNYNEFNRKGWLYPRNVADSQKDWVGRGYVSTFYDVFNKEAQKGFWDLLNNKLYKRGVDAWWMDASEPDILSNVSPQRRKEQMTPTALGPAALYLNAYPLQNAKGIYEGQRAANNSSRVLILTRSAFAGSQRYAAVTWSGDIASRWHDMKSQISAGVNFSMSGIPYWTMDIGGFAVESRFEQPDEGALEEWRELQTRWFQFGAFVPLFRAHGQFPFREMYNIAPEDHAAYQSMLYYDKLRYRLMPYIYSLAGAAYHDDGTIMRGLVMDFPSDRRVLDLNDQYLFGPALLINPVYQYRQRERNVYLPNTASWYDLITGTHHSGGQTLSAAAPYERMPVYVRAGSILPVGPELQYTDEKPAQEITLFIYTGADGRFVLYEDEGVNYNYEKGMYSMIPLNYDHTARTLTIGKRNGSFNGMMAGRKFNIVWISPGKPGGIDHPVIDKSIDYSGEQIKIKMP